VTVRTVEWNGHVLARGKQWVRGFPDGPLPDDVDLDQVLSYRGDPDPQVRLEVAAQLPSWAGEPPDDRVVEALIDLTGDPDDDVRSWATFALSGQLPAVDTPAVGAALWARTADQDAETARHALRGLAQRHDPRAFGPVAEAIQRPDVNYQLIEAAGAFGDATFLDALERLKARGWEAENYPYDPVLDRAIDACRPQPGEQQGSGLPERSE